MTRLSEKIIANSEVRSRAGPSRALCGLVFAGLLAVAWSAPANTLVATDTDDDATLTLSIEDTLLAGVNQQWGTLLIDITGNSVALNSGDTVDLFLYEDDLVADDLLWQDTLTVTGAEATAGLLDRTLNLIFSAPLDDPGGSLEIFAEALVNKSACGAFCVADNPLTSNLSVGLAPVPVPAAVWLFASSLGLLAAMRRRLHLYNRQFSAAH